MTLDAVRRGAAWIGKGVLSGFAVAILLILVGVPRPSNAFESWFDVRPAFVVLGQTAGLALAIGGLAAVWVVRPLLLGVMAIVAGLSWLAPDLVGARAATDLGRSVALLGGPLLLPAIAGLLVTTARPPAGGAARVAVVAGALLVVAVTVGRALTWVPFDDPRCWTFCDAHRNVLALTGDAWRGVNRALLAFWDALSIVGWATLAAWCLRRLRERSTITGPPRLALSAGVVVAVAESIWSLEAWLRRTDPPNPVVSGWLWPVWIVQAVGLIVLGLAVGQLSIAAVRRARALQLSIDTLGSLPAPGELRASLARALGDPTLTVSYVLDDGSLVDSVGRPVAARSGTPARAATTIERKGEPIAIVEHDASLEGPLLIRQIGAAARLAVDNERLRASVLARVADLRQSQARIVAVADEERRRLERNLHDGAQQRLLALSFEVRVALAAARRAGDAVVEASLERADEAARTAIGELRSLAHGIYPAILRDTGLAPALETLADDTPIPVTVQVRSRDRCEFAVEVIGYQVVADALFHAVRSGATYAVVSIDRSAGSLLIEVRDDGRDGIARPEQATSMTDRVGAAGGRLTVAPNPTGAGQLIQAMLPCA